MNSATTQTRTRRFPPKHASHRIPVPPGSRVLLQGDGLAQLFGDAAFAERTPAQRRNLFLRIMDRVRAEAQR